MEYTLFIDESGNFKTDRETWTVAGVLVPGAPADAEKLVRKRIAPALMEEGFDTAGSAHLWEIRARYTHERALRIAGRAFDALGSEKDEYPIRVGAVRNRGRVAVGTFDADADTYEQTYRLMVLDLLALLESSLPERVHMEELYLVVARRKREEADVPMTSRGAFLQDVINQIRDALEAGLASRGLLASASDRHLSIVKASQRWGLAAADFAANISKNEEHASDFIEQHREGPLAWRLFDAFGSYEQRRARIAERDGDVATALVRWALLTPRGSEERQEREEAMHRLWGRALADKDPFSPRAAMETVLERLRKAADPSRLSPALEDLEAQLAAHEDPRLETMLFRFRSFARRTAHMHGDTARSTRYSQIQRAMRPQLLRDPSGFSLVLDDDLYDITALQHRLDLEGALEVAQRYEKLVSHYGEVWELFDGTGGRAAFEQSRVYLRARMTKALAESFVGALGRDELLASSLRTLEEVHIPEMEADIRRLRNYRMGVYTRVGDHGLALALAQEALEVDDPDEFDLYNALRAAASAALYDVGAYGDTAEALFATAWQYDLEGPANPYHLIWREVALLRHQVRHPGADVMAALDHARARTGQLGDGPIRMWLLDVLRVHQAHISGDGIDLARLLERSSEEGGELLREAAEKVAAEKGPLAAVRHVSPY